jgi:hypothetical protein
MNFLQNACRSRESNRVIQTSMQAKGCVMLRLAKEGRLLVPAIVLSLAAGWWARGPHVEAKESAAYAPTQFQMSNGRDGSILSVYYPDQRMLYTYPAQAGSSNIACINSFKIGDAGQQIERQNCPNGKLY